MNKFLVAFKGTRKFHIDAQDEETAKKWAEVQMAYWRRTLKFSVTQIIKAEKVEKKAESNGAK
jgi:hypothetical protein